MFRDLARTLSFAHNQGRNGSDLSRENQHWERMALLSFTGSGRPAAKPTMHTCISKSISMTQVPHIYISAARSRQHKQLSQEEQRQTRLYNTRKAKTDAFVQLKKSKDRRVCPTQEEQRQTRLSKSFGNYSKRHWAKVQSLLFLMDQYEPNEYS